jgi:hypothetical protein
MTLVAEAWEPVLFAGLIPILGATAIAFLLWHAVRQKPEKEIGKKKEEEREEEVSRGKEEETGGSKS